VLHQKTLPPRCGKGAIDPCRDGRYSFDSIERSASLAIPRPLSVPSFAQSSRLGCRSVAKIVHRVARVGRVTQVPKALTIASGSPQPRATKDTGRYPAAIPPSSVATRKAVSPSLPGEVGKPLGMSKMGSPRFRETAWQPSFVTCCHTRV